MIALLLTGCNKLNRENYDKLKMGDHLCRGKRHPRQGRALRRCPRHHQLRLGRGGQEHQDPFHRRQGDLLQLWKGSTESDSSVHCQQKAPSGAFLLFANPPKGGQKLAHSVGRVLVVEGGQSPMKRTASSRSTKPMPMAPKAAQSLGSP